VKGNTTFTAYLTDEEPKLVESLQPLTIQRNLIVPDDHKEYWGFYLLKGSTFRIHTCAR
jgi:peptidyl-prolyl cis-trans isomerase SDCCAG10